ncbi:MAG: sigma-70 family RNA polymerase sigma factor [Planctomycetota bacterium]
MHGQKLRLSMTPLDLEQHLHQHGHALRGLAQDLVRDPNVADDLVQATLASALRKPPAQPGPIGGWLSTVLRRLHLQHRRTEQRREERERATARPESLPPTIDLVERRETLQAVTSAVFSLDEPYQTSVLLRYFEGLTPSEIALRTDTSVATVKSRLQRALLLVRGRLDRTRGDRRRWTKALCAATGLQILTTTAILGTGALLMGSATKLVLGGAAAVLLGALVWGLRDTEPPPMRSNTTAANIAPAATATAVLDAATPDGVDRVALPDPSRDESALLHAFGFELEVQVQDHFGLPVEGAKVLLAPFGCRLDEVPDRTDSAGIVHVQWRGKNSSMPMVVATRADETRDATRQVVVASGSKTRMVLGGSSAQRGTIRLMRSAERVGSVLSFTLPDTPRSAGSTWLSLDGIVLQQGSFADNPVLREGLHPFATFGDVQWQKREEPTQGQSMEVAKEIKIGVSLSRLAFDVVGGDIQLSRPDEAHAAAARIGGIVYGEDGKPCSKCPVVWGTVVDRPNGRTETDERGAFAFDNVPEGALELRAGGGDAGLQHATVRAVAGQTATLDLYLKRQATVRGRAVDKDGKPLAGWRVEWVSGQTPWFDACTVADDGTYVLPNLPGDTGRLLLWRGKGQSSLPALVTGDVLPNSGEVELRFDAELSSGVLQLEPALPNGVDKATVEARIFQEDTGRGATLRKGKEGNRFSLTGLAAGWYRIELGGPGLGWLDGGRHYVDGKSLVDLGRVAMPQAGSLRLHMPDAATEGANTDALAVEIYHRRGDCDVRIDDPAEAGRGTVPLPAGNYFAMWRSATGGLEFEPFTVQSGREVDVHSIAAKARTRPSNAAGSADKPR